MKNIKSGFKKVASERRIARSMGHMRSSSFSLADRFLFPTSPSGSTTLAGSESPSSASNGLNNMGMGVREKDLERALSAAVSSLNVLGQIHDAREARWKEEMRRIGEDRERVELVLGQILGASRLGGAGIGGGGGGGFGGVPVGAGGFGGMPPMTMGLAVPGKNTFMGQGGMPTPPIGPHQQQQYQQQQQQEVQQQMQAQAGKQA